jgi:hypothetical protein
MSYKATVMKILVASPSDVPEERQAIPEVIYTWNSLHSEDFGVVLLPVKWETHAAPEMGGRPQGILGDQIVDTCDLLVGTFWTRIGTNTGKAVSGTVEEVDTFRRSQKPVMLYFSSRDVDPTKIDLVQYEQLSKYKDECFEDGIVWEYSNIEELKAKLTGHLTKTVKKLLKLPKLSFQDVSLEENRGKKSMVFDEGEFASKIADWKSERDSEPEDLNDGKSILTELCHWAIDTRAKIHGLTSDQELERLDYLITEIKKLRRHEFFLDGGKSYNEFWQIGDKLLGEFSVYFRTKFNMLNQYSPVEKTGSSLPRLINPLEIKFEKVEVPIIDFFNENYLPHRNKKFVECAIHGPAMVLFEGASIEHRI